MKIDITNLDLLSTDIYIHDSIFYKMEFNYQSREKNIRVELETPYISGGKRYNIDFYNVIGFDMVSCDFWGKSPHILDWEPMKSDRKVLIKRLFEEQFSDKNYNASKLANRKESDFIETLFTFTSGDRLRIACEYIVIENTDWFY